MNATRNECVCVKIGATGVKIPRRVGTWTQYGMPIFAKKNGIESVLFTMFHDTLAKSPNILVTHTGTVVCDKITDHQLMMDQIQKEGWEIQ